MIELNVRFSAGVAKKLYRQSTQRNSFALLFLGLIAAMILWQALGNSKYVLAPLPLLWLVVVHRRQKQQGDTIVKCYQDIGPDIHYLFEKDKISIQHHKGQRQYEWTTVSHFQDLPDFLLIYYLNLSAIVIPKEQVTKDELAEIMVLLREKTGIPDRTRVEKKRRTIILIAMLALALLFLACAVYTDWFV